MILNDTLRQEYEDLFNNLVIQPERQGEINGFVVQLLSGKDHYDEASSKTTVPWYVIGLIHGLECSFDFGTHLHNGDSLKHRTVNDPAGRPPHSVEDPPFEWIVSAVDALQYDNLSTWTDWSLAGILFKLEGYNGWGYRHVHPPIHTPYLWSYSNYYEKGKFGSDGLYDPDLVSKQVGAAVALWKMVTDHTVDLPAQSV